MIKSIDQSAFIKKQALAQGFSFCGISKTAFLAEEAPKLEAWLKAGNHGKMQYMENHFDKRLDPEKLVPGAKSIISLLYNYYTDAEQGNERDIPRISKYALGTDYHVVIKDKLKTLVQSLQTEIGDFNARVFVDSAPVMERVWAAKSGLGWQGKNTLLINKSQGSYFFLAEIICDLELEADNPIKDYCGTCTACIDACPTEAITPYYIEAEKCISYLTIELKEEIDSHFHGKMDNWLFGCDICQEVCPWNRFAQKHQEKQFEPIKEILGLTKQDWQEMTEDVFRKNFKNSPLKRAKLSGIQKNLKAL